MELQPHDPWAGAKFIHPAWSELYKRVLRTAGLDAELNLKFAPLQRRMDAELDAYNGNKQELEFLIATQNVELILPTEEEVEEYGGC